VLAFYAASGAPALHLAYLHLHLFDSPPADPPPADRIAHLEAASLLAVSSLGGSSAVAKPKATTKPPTKAAVAPMTADEAVVLCDDIAAQLRTTRPWWVAWSKLPDQRAAAYAVLQRCLVLQTERALLSSDASALLVHYREASSHLGAFRPLDLARFALALQASGDHNQAYEILRSIPLAAYKDLPAPLRVDLQAAHVALALRLNADLKLSKLSCAPAGPLPASPEQAVLLDALGTRPVLMEQRVALLSLQLSLARYAEALETLGAILPEVATTEAAASLDVPGLVASSVQCLYDAHQLPLLVAVPALLDGFDAAQRRSILGASVAGVSKAQSVDALLQDAHLRFVMSLPASSPAQTTRALAVLNDLQGRWTHGALSPALLLVLADLQRASGLPAEALLTLDTLQSVYASDPLADDALWLAANLLLEQQKPEQARALLLKILSDHPSGSHLWRANDLLEHIPQP
jgi:tetratricopeptide (TPR) repeat protein